MTMEEAVSTHVLDHLVNGPVAHRDLMDAAQSADAELTALRQQVADLRAALEPFARQKTRSDPDGTYTVTDDGNVYFARAIIRATQPQEVQA